MILMYHQIDSSGNPFSLPLSRFHQQLKIIKEQEKYFPTSLFQYVQWLGIKRKDGHTPLCLTFDDGYANFEKEILPLLEEFEIPACIFIPTDFVGKTNSWDMAKGRPVQKIISWEGLQRLANHPLITLASHGKSHRRFSELSIAEKRKELLESKSRLESELKTPIEFFSFPYGQKRDIGSQSDLLLAEAGFLGACSTNWRRKNGLKHLRLLNRVEIRPDMSETEFENLFTKRFHWKRWKQFVKNRLTFWGA